MSLTINGSQITFPDGSGQNTAATDFGFKNRLINGGMAVDQRNAGAAFGTSINGYGLDRWIVAVSSTGKLNGGQNYNSITPPVGFKNYIGVQSQSAYSMSNTDYYLLRQVVEANNAQDLGWGTANAQAVTVSFWVRSSLTGTFSFAMTNYTGAPNAAGYFTTYQINTANTWEYKTITVPGPTGGTWGTGTAAYLTVDFDLGIGTTYTAPANNTWTYGNTLLGATGSIVSLVGTNGATFYVTGVQLEKGSTATSFDWRPFTTELTLCQRYYEKSFELGTKPAIGNYPGRELPVTYGGSDGYHYSTVRFRVDKRTTPTVVVYGFGSTAAVYVYKGPYIGDASWLPSAQLSSKTIDGYSFAYAVNAMAASIYGWIAEAEL